MHVCNLIWRVICVWNWASKTRMFTYHDSVHHMALWLSFSWSRKLADDDLRIDTNSNKHIYKYTHTMNSACTCAIFFLKTAPSVSFQVFTTCTIFLFTYTTNMHTYDRFPYLSCAHVLLGLCWRTRSARAFRHKKFHTWCWTHEFPLLILFWP